MLFPTTRLLTDADLTEALGVKETTLRKWRHERKIPYTKVNGSVRYVPEDIESFIRAGRVAGMSEPMAAGGPQ